MNEYLKKHGDKFNNFDEEDDEDDEENDNFFYCEYDSDESFNSEEWASVKNSPKNG
jgi:hypothetical protein